MSKGSIIIIEDEFFAAEHLSDLVKSLGFTVAGIHHSGEQFLKETSWDFDAAIIDIFLSGELTGLDLAIRMNEKQKSFIFLTANQDAHTLSEAARLSPASYLSKPFKSNDVAVALEIISLKMSPKIPVRTNNSIRHINSNEILYIKSDGSYIEIYTTNEKIVQRKLLKEIGIELPISFVKVHRSYLVNKNYITQKSSNCVKIGDIEIPISRSFKVDLL